MCSVCVFKHGGAEELIESTLSDWALWPLKQQTTLTIPCTSLGRVYSAFLGFWRGAIHLLRVLTAVVINIPDQQSTEHSVDYIYLIDVPKSSHQDRKNVA